MDWTPADGDSPFAHDSLETSGAFGSIDQSIEMIIIEIDQMCALIDRSAKKL